MSSSLIRSTFCRPAMCRHGIRGPAKRDPSLFARLAQKDRAQACEAWYSRSSRLLGIYVAVVQRLQRRLGKADTRVRVPSAAFHLTGDDTCSRIFTLMAIHEHKPSHPTNV